MNVTSHAAKLSAKVYSLPMACLLLALVLAGGCKERNIYGDEPPPAQEEQGY